MRRARGSGREAAVRRGHGRLQAAAPITHTHLCVRTRVYMPMPSLLSPISLCASIAMGRLIARLNNRLRLGSCGAGSLFPSQQPPTALHVTKMLSAGTPLHPHGSWGKSFGWVHPAPACTRAHAAPDPPPPKAKHPLPVCWQQRSCSPLHPQPLPSLSPASAPPYFSMAPLSSTPHQRAPGPGDCSCHGTFLQLWRNPGGKEESPAKTNPPPRGV